MRCPNVKCRAELLPEDKHCPLCGTAAAGDGETATARPRDEWVLETAQRVTSDQAPASVIVEHGEAYPALRGLSHLAIATGSFLRWALSALSLVLCVLAMIAGYREGYTLIGLIIGILFLAAGMISGWLIWLGMAVAGEMVYLILDLAETFRRSFGRREQ